MRTEVYSKSSDLKFIPLVDHLSNVNPYTLVLHGNAEIHATRNASTMKDPVQSVQTTFCVHLIAISGSKRRPKVRMLFVETAGADVVYEGQGSWSKCIRWIKQLTVVNSDKPDLAAAKKEFGRGQYATLPEVRASVLDIESMGLQRVDK